MYRLIHYKGVRKQTEAYTATLCRLQMLFINVSPAVAFPILSINNSVNLLALIILYTIDGK